MPLREELGIAEEATVVGMVGRITHWKGQDVLAEAAALVLRTHPAVHFVAVGSYFADEAHYLETLKARIEELAIGKNFHLVEYRQNVSEVYKALDIAVLPSKKPEPFGRVTVEAMMSECPVVATDHGGTSELIQHGITGLLIPPSDPGRLAEAINSLISQPETRRKMGKAAAVHAYANFSLGKYCERMSALLWNLIYTVDNRKFDASVPS